MDHLSQSTSCEKKDEIQWNQFSQWVHCFAVVTFDLELGQAMEVGLHGSFYLLLSGVNSIL